VSSPLANLYANSTVPSPTTRPRRPNSACFSSKNRAINPWSVNLHGQSNNYRWNKKPDQVRGVEEAVLTLFSLAALILRQRKLQILLVIHELIRDVGPNVLVLSSLAMLLCKC
jgi:hypothetical protein